MAAADVHAVVPAVDVPARRPVIEVRDLHEVFRIYKEAPPSLKERLYKFRRAAFSEFHALDGVDLTVYEGETVGLVGHNGSGKSTLLKCMARILPPDQGTVAVHGRIATLLELGAGFSAELTGRENCYLNGSLLGLSRAEVDAAFDSIVDFAGVRDFIDTPVKNYSSGMYVRLGFAIAVHVDPEILLVDEVLAVGDAVFQEKSLARMRRLKESGRTVVLVSHDLGSVAEFCDRVIVLEHGRVLFDGPTEQGLVEYERRISAGKGEPSVVALEPEPRDRDGDRAARITAVHLDTGDHDPARGVPVGTHARLEVEVSAEEQLVGAGGLYLAVTLRRPDLPTPVYTSRTSWRVTYVAPPPPGQTLRALVDLDLNVLTGSYLFDVEIGNAETDALHDRCRDAARVLVLGETHDQGIAPVDLRFTLDNPEGVWPPESLPPELEHGGPRQHPSPLWPLGGQPPKPRG